VAYALKDRARDPEGYLFHADTDAAGKFQITLYRRGGLVTCPDTATVRLHGTTVSPQRAASGLLAATPRWQGNAEALVTYVRVGGTLTVATARVVVDQYVPK
jgi:hypothetical protein